MESCEICGRKTETTYSIKIEGAQMLVCEGCSKGHEVLNTFGEPKHARSTYNAPRKSEMEETEMVEGYGSIIRQARESMGLTLKVFAERINETESSLRRIEKGNTVPTDKVTKKIEKELGIKLISKRIEGRGDQRIMSSGPLTLWDAAIKKGKKNNVGD